MARRKLGWAFGLCVLILRRPLLILTRRDWRGAEHLPRSGGCVVVVNHVSEFDPIPFGHFVYDNGRLPRFLGKAEVFDVPVVGAILTSAGQIPVYRKSTDAAKAFSAAVAAVEDGECVIVYAEGTLTRDPGLWPMVGKTGAARVALTTGCPVIPAAQWGPQDVLAPYGLRPRLLPRKLMQIRAGSPVDLSPWQGQPLTPVVLREATGAIVGEITRLLEEIRGERAPSVRFDPRAAGVAEIGNPHRSRTHRRGSDLTGDDAPKAGH
ncbi:MAG: 1-acyl-sn-glycerol-3-phosphate acyltransferase [Propionibacteriales bacterium]|nr:1-acyl-sn-glycerol-3-phosphate acyltransferase [Propionibacteriales bacterium]